MMRVCTNEGLLIFLPRPLNAAVGIYPIDYRHLSRLNSLFCQFLAYRPEFPAFFTA